MKPLNIGLKITNRKEESLDKYFNEINKIQLISIEKETELAFRIKKGDQQALGELINANLRFVVSVAKQYQNQGLSLSDLIGEGNIGLIKAATKFDETRGFKFISYAVWWIRQTIIHAINQNTKLIRLPLNKVSLINKINKVKHQFEQDHNRKPSAQEIADSLEVTVTEIDVCLESSKKSISMDQSISEEGDFNLHDIIQSKDFPSPEATLITDSLQKDLQAVFNSLSTREAEIVKLYYGIGGENALSLNEIAELLEITTERVRQIKQAAIIQIKSSGRANILVKYLG